MSLLPRSIAVLAFVSLALSAAAAHPQTASQELRVMSFNVRLPLAADGANEWRHRRDLAAQAIRRHDPDVIGTQELYRAQGEDLIARLPQYTWFGEGRRGGGDDEHMGVFYRKDRLRVVESGDFWLSDTPDIPGSISWGHPLPRMATWALFERTHDGRRFYLFNTHLPYREQDEDARVRGARLILQRLSALPADVPVVLTGDFNALSDGPTHTVLTATLRDAWLDAPRRRGPDGTFHEFTGTPQRRIDWILVRGFHVVDAHTLTTHAHGRYPSDHFPLLARLRWTAQAVN